MMGRIASLAFLLGSLTTGLAWLTIQPTLVRLMDAQRAQTPTAGSTAVLAHLPHLLPLWMGLHLGASTLLIFVFLVWMVGRPLAHLERSIEQVGRLELELPLERGTGPLVARVQASLRRMAEALRAEQAHSGAQMAALRRANAELTRTQTELVAAERLATVGRLAAGVAHEVGNPLSGMLGYLSVLKARLDARSDVHEFLLRIENEIQRIDGIVRSLLELGRPSQGARVPVPLEPLIEGCVVLLRAGADFRNVHIEQRVTPGLCALGEGGALSQILVNLLLNAAQAMEGQGVVTVTAHAEGGAVLLRVEDEGPGIAPEVLAELFTPFYTTKPPGKGTGLGLAVSRHLARSLGGELEATNRALGGACLTLRLPMPEVRVS